LKKVGRHAISEAKHYAQMNGYGAPELEKPTIHKKRFEPEQLAQFDEFFTDKAHVSMSSYKSEAKSGLPILYLQNHKKSLWEKFIETYPNGMRRTAFMTRLEGGRFVYRENLGGLCSICNENGYEVFDQIRKLIEKHIIAQVFITRLS